MTYSLNEAEAMAKKAVRGAGYPWGIAEDASKAVRLLEEHGLDGCSALSRLLLRLDGQPVSARMPGFEAGVWRAGDGRLLCPLLTGPVASDRGASILDQPFVTGPIAEPLLLIPFVHMIARSTGSVISIETGPAYAVTDGSRIAVVGEFPAMVDGARIARGGLLRRPQVKHGRADPGASAWDVLDRFAHRTYAPATEESRRKGAG